MKKNLISVLIMALVLANLILTAVLTISILPQTKKANELITKVCAAIDLDLTNGEEEEKETIPMDQVEAYALDEGNKMTINLKKGEDGVAHYAVMGVTLGVNTKSKDYKAYGSAEELKAKEGLIAGKINSVISSHTYEEMRDDQEMIQDELLKELNKMYNSDFIISVAFTASYE